MYWLSAKSAVVLLPTATRWRSLAGLLRSSSRKCCLTFGSPQLLKLKINQNDRVYCFRDRKAFRVFARTTKKVRNSVGVDVKNLPHIMWWKERLEICKKASTVQLVKRIVYSNLLGLDVNLKSGSLKEGSLNWEMLQFKSRFPREVLLCRVGEFYEAIGIDACLLVEFAGLNPFGGLRTESVPRAGCPVMNLRQTLDDLTRNGYSVCIVEEVQGPAQARSRKGRFISGHAHPGSPYVFGHVGVDDDLDFPEPMPVIGLSRSARGYSIVLILETMKTFSTEDGLTEEALVTKLRTYRCHYLFLHASLKNNASGTCRWGEFGEGGLLWAECSSRQFEWFEGDPVTELLTKVKEVYGLDDEVIFKNVTVPSEGRPRPLHLGTATQIGAIPTEGIPCLLNVLLPPSCTGLPVLYMRDLLLNPPPYAITFTIQEICKTMSKVTCSLPEFTCVSSAKLVKLIELREANHVEFCRIKNVADEVLELYSNTELSKILKLLMDPTWMATGLKIEFDTLVSECEWISCVIGEMISLDNDVNQEIISYPHIPDEFLEDIESSWKGRVQRIHLEDLYREVEQAAQALHLAVIEDFLPIVTRVKAVTAPLGGPKGEILYAREQQAVWFKGKRFVPSVWAGTPGEAQIKQLKPSLDAKGRKVGEEWFTTAKVEEALLRYHMANDKARAKVLELLRHLSFELQSRINVLVFASMLLIIAKALFAHVSEGRRRNWIFPTLAKFHSAESSEPLGEVRAMKLNGLLPYWFDTAKGSPVRNTLHMQSLFLLTGPNGGGKSSLLRSVCAAALLGICGLMVPAESALIPHFDSIYLHMKSYDSPVDGKSSFQIEMSEVRSIITGTTSKSLVLIDEICRGTETAKGTCIAGSIIETLDARGCLGIVSTHLHGIFDLPLSTVSTVYKAMSAECVNGQIVPTWKLKDGICRESLAFETAQREGIPENLIRRAEELYCSVYADGLLRKTGKEEYQKVTSSEEYVLSDLNNTGFDEGDSFPGVLTRKSIHSDTHSGKQRGSGRTMENLQKDVRKAVGIICEKKLAELQKGLESPECLERNCILVSARQQPPPTTIGASCVYVLLQPDRKLYVGQTDDLQGRVRAHRSKDGMQNAAFLYFVVQGKSLACKMETLLINQLPSHGFHLTNVADGKHRNFGASDTILEDIAVCR
ncbi:hypothetical protein Drorol1_Dr00013587 [Drosera rotundifolia]